MAGSVELHRAATMLLLFLLLTVHLLEDTTLFQNLISYSLFCLSTKI
jgi:hypothetical protein